MQKAGAWRQALTALTQTSQRLWLLAGALGLWAVLASVLPTRPEALPDDRPALFSLLDALPAGKVELRRPGGAFACEWKPEERRFPCSGEAWNFVGPYVERAAGRPLACLWMHPQPGQVSTQLSFAAVPLGARLWARLALVEPARPGGEVHLRVAADGRDALALDLRDHRELAEKEVDLGPGPSSGRLELSLRADTNDWRLACVDLRMHGPRPAAASAGAPTRPSPQRLRVLQGPHCGPAAPLVAARPSPCRADSSPPAGRAASSQAALRRPRPEGVAEAAPRPGRPPAPSPGGGG